jgi:hypothetical protein
MDKFGPMLNNKRLPDLSIYQPLSIHIIGRPQKAKYRNVGSREMEDFRCRQVVGSHFMTTQLPKHPIG